jgi:uncharacterized repeat protein (TIGR03803 family)
MKNKAILLGIMGCALLVGSGWAADTENIVYNFSGGNDGGNPATRLIFDRAGNIYGTTAGGGAHDCGTVFELTPIGGGHWQESVLHSFNCSDEGNSPYGGVVADAQGNLYGTTFTGGSGGICSGDGCGVVFKLTYSGGAWSETVLYSFHDSPDVRWPDSAVALDAAGNVYGTAASGAYGFGGVYQVSQHGDQWIETVIHNFTGGDDGAFGSSGAPFIDSVGSVYGVTEGGGLFGSGTVYELSSGPGETWIFHTLYAFGAYPDGANPLGGLVRDTQGNLYSTTYYGGTSGAGTVFKLRPGSHIGSWKETTLYDFEDARDGGHSSSTLIFDPAGDLYGTTSTGGDGQCECGVAFELSPTGGGGWIETVLHVFTGSLDGGFPYYGLTADGAGNYFGAAVQGGTQGQGIVYELTP